jgi:hypothetical protein
MAALRLLRPAKAARSRRSLNVPPPLTFRVFDGGKPTYFGNFPETVALGADDVKLLLGSGTMAPQVRI